MKSFLPQFLSIAFPSLLIMQSVMVSSLRLARYHRWNTDKTFSILRSTVSDSTGRETASKTGGRASAAVLQAQDSAEGKKGQVEISLAPPKGTRDFYPEDHRLKNWLFDIWRETARKYSFEEYDAPVVENVDLYIRKAGEEVTQQLYDFEDKSGRRLSLRPEMTPSLARMVLAKRNTLPFPLKWFSIPQCWRYERMTRGRRREHYQWNMDMFGVAGVEAEAELLSSVIFTFEQMGLSSKEVGIKINSRKLLNDLMARVGIDKEKWVATCVLVDKLDKTELSTLTKEVEELGVPMTTMEALVALLKLRTIDEYAAQLGESAEGVQDVRKLFNLLTRYGYGDWLEFDPTVVRGLAYYTGVVFEGFDRSRELRAICGGGRYDRILESFGGEAVPAVGFGFGDAVIVELLKMKSLLPDFSRNPIDCMMFAIKDEALRMKMIPIAQQLRQAGLSVDMVLEDRKPKWVFQRADKMGAKKVVVLGPDEDVAGEAVVKDMTSGEQIRVKYDSLAAHLRQQ